MPLNSSMKKMHLLTFINACWIFTKTKQYVISVIYWIIVICVTTKSHFGLSWIAVNSQNVVSCTSLVKMYNQRWWLCEKLVLCSQELALLNSVIVLPVNVFMWKIGGITFGASTISPPTTLVFFPSCSLYSLTPSLPISLFPFFDFSCFFLHLLILIFFNFYYCFISFFLMTHLFLSYLLSLFSNLFFHIFGCLLSPLFF